MARVEPHEHSSGKIEGRKASPRWIVPPFFLFSLLGGAASSVEMESYSQIACRAVAAADATFPQPATAFSTFLSNVGTGTDEEDWLAACRTSPEVQKRTTTIITSILLVAGTLSALTAAYWGAVADRRGRKLVLFVCSAAELLEALIMILVLTFPNSFGYRSLLLLAAFAGLSGGELASMAVASAYLGDCAGVASKTQLLSNFEASLFAGLGLGPLIGSAFFRYTNLGPIGPYILMACARSVYLLAMPLMPESLPPSMRSKPSTDPATPDRALLLRTLALPKELVRPFRVLLPNKVEGGRKRDWRLLLVAVSGAMLLIVPGLGPVKVLYARGKYGWGPTETGQWITFCSACKLVLLLGVLPLVGRYLRGPAPLPAKSRPDDLNARAREEQIAWDAEAEQLKKQANAAYDLSLARWTILITSFGYLIMVSPLAGTSSTPFLVSSAVVSFASATPPALQSLALTLSGPEDAGKVLACLSALATVSMSTIGPSAFGAAYVFAVDWWPELIFLLAAIWVGSALIPLLGVCVERLAQADDSDEDELAEV
ncbi:uncharacterized protein JCM10292_007401 [Rhodotorula paludigena]|uniref:uncharacterized protein n=1 Tax=Rhodotorula paludigena TaxID=86838 RepID=UPI00317FE2FE